MKIKARKITKKNHLFIYKKNFFLFVIDVLNFKCILMIVDQKKQII